MTRLRLPAALALLALAAGCRLFPTEPARSVGADVRITTTGRGTVDSTEVVAAFFSLTGGERIAFRNDTLRVQDVAATRAGGERRVFVVRVPLDSAAAEQGLRVRLPEPTLGPVPLSEFTIASAARRGSPSVTLRAGQDLLLPVVRGTSGTLPTPEFERWEVSFSRGGHITSISGGGPLPSPVRVPWALIPTEGTETMQVRVSSFRLFRVETETGAGDRMLTSIHADAALEWSVRIVP
jgi:hypothetical protein